MAVPFTMLAGAPSRARIPHAHDSGSIPGARARRWPRCHVIASACAICPPKPSDVANAIPIRQLAIPGLITTRTREGDSLSWRERSVSTTTQGDIPRGPTRPDSSMLPPGSPVSCELATVPKHAVAKMDGTRNLDLGGEMLPYSTIPATISSPLSSLSTHSRNATLAFGRPSNGSRTLCRFLGWWDPENMSFAVQQQNPWWRHFTLSQVARVF